MSDHRTRGATRPESGLTDHDFSPIWADDARPRIPRVVAEREALAAYLDYYRATVDMRARGLTAQPESAFARDCDGEVDDAQEVADLTSSTTFFSTAGLQAISA